MLLYCKVKKKKLKFWRVYLWDDFILGECLIRHFWDMPFAIVVKKHKNLGKLEISRTNYCFVYSASICQNLQLNFFKVLNVP